MSELCFELAPVAAGCGLVEVGLKTEVEVEGDGREAFGLGAEQRASRPRRNQQSGAAISYRSNTARTAKLP